MIPTHTAIIPNLDTNLSIYFANGVYYYYDIEANPAICPIKVLSPVNNTTPLPLPYLFNVEKKAIFLDYKGLLGLVHYADLANSSVSPVNEELSTFMPLD